MVDTHLMVGIQNKNKSIWKIFDLYEFAYSRNFHKFANSGQYLKELYKFHNIIDKSEIFELYYYNIDFIFYSFRDPRFRRVFYSN